MLRNYTMTKKTDIDQFRDTAERHMQDGQYEKAIELYRKLARMNPGDDSLVMSLAWAYKDSGKTDEAVQCLEGLLEKELKRTVFTGFAFDELVRIYREQGSHVSLVGICEKAVACQPDDTALLSTLGDSCLRAGKAERAVEVFEILVKMDPDSPVNFCNLGNAYIIMGNFAEAEASYEKAISIEPLEVSHFYDRLGDAYYKAGQYERAEIILKKSLDKSSGHPLLYCNLGDTLIKQGKLKEAQALYKNAAEIDPASKGAYYNRMGNMLAREKHHIDAIESFEKAISVDPGNQFYYLSLLQSCEAEGLHEKAREVYERAKALNVFS
jgi:tetratricopeptide (TPR) repeat protein